MVDENFNLESNVLVNEMFSLSKNRTKSTLLCGPLEFTKSFVFEAAIHWADQGHRVIYITPAPLQSLPAIYHDRDNFSSASFKLMRFMYLENYETLVDQLVDLHNFQILPSVLLIDDLDAYIQEPQQQTQVARLCSVITDSMNACSRILKSPVHLCVSTSITEMSGTPYPLYFQDVWHLRVLSSNENGQILRISQTRENQDGMSKVFDYQRFTNGTLVLKEISERFVSQGGPKEILDAHLMESNHTNNGR